MAAAIAGSLWQCATLRAIAVDGVVRFDTLQASQGDYSGGFAAAYKSQRSHVIALRYYCCPRSCLIRSRAGHMNVRLAAGWYTVAVLDP